MTDTETMDGTFMTGVRRFLWFKTVCQARRHQLVQLMTKNTSVYLRQACTQFLLDILSIFCSRATRPYETEPADPRLFFNENTVFFIGVIIIATLPKVFKTIALNTRLFFLA